MTTTSIQDLAAAGVSVWLDDLSRERLESGNLAEMVQDHGVVGVTTNPSIFAAALARGERYTDQVVELKDQGADVERAVFALTTTDVQRACDVMMPVYELTKGVDGRVSIEVDPRLARDAERTVEVAQELVATVDRPNVMIKIPATVEALPAISRVLAEGISVNVTLIFSLDRYRAVMNAFMTGIEQAREAGKDLSTIHSVASFFVSRVDTEIDERLDALGTDEAKALKGQAGIANARLAYHAWQEQFATPRWANLADDGANAQRPLWASTGVKDPAYPDTMYVDQLVAPQVVNTMPEKTLEATADHGRITGDTITGHIEESEAVMDALERQGISYDEVVDLLEREGVEKFETSWQELLATVQGELDKH
ncbi:transaldolase [Arsenicicoccus dermatophilus]|uniref:transaldolase n=1 Tax=Arsenicicoccus dermatophilus TaxID=1076331 RepID=UPI001F4D338F|nr:transaldolase [Arsenicicoccus dermatophilus]MCH8612580.1 transaldolase [Arsenicicoccus dermatophilus]